MYQEWSNGFSYKKNDFYIVFVTAKEYLQYNRYRNGLNHVAFHGGSKNDVDLLRTKLSERNDVQLLDDELYPHAGGEECYALYFEERINSFKIQVVASETESSIGENQ